MLLKIEEENLTCVPDFMKSGIDQNESDRFPCSTCGKSYLRRRHLQRHMRDECIGIPPRFHCEMCPSKFRRKYHLVRHLSSKHGIITPPTPVTHKKSSDLIASVKKESNNIAENREITNLLMNNFDKFSVEALMMKQENALPVISNVIGADQLSEMANNGEVPFAHLGLQQTFQNLKNLFVSYSLNNVSN